MRRTSDMFPFELKIPTIFFSFWIEWTNINVGDYLDYFYFSLYEVFITNHRINNQLNSIQIYKDLQHWHSTRVNKTKTADYWNETLLNNIVSEIWRFLKVHFMSTNWWLCNDNMSACKMDPRWICLSYWHCNCNIYASYTLHILSWLKFAASKDIHYL